MPAKSERVREAEDRVAKERRQSHLLTAALAHMHQGLCMYDQEGNVAVCNERYSEIIGLPSGAVRPGMSGRELIELVIEAGHFAGKTADEVESELWKSVCPDSADSSGNITRGDRTFSSHHMFTDDGFWVVTHDDITAQVEAENALRKSQSRLNSILEALPDCVQIFDAEGKLVYINSSGLRLFEAPDIASLSRPGFSEIPPEYQQSYQDLHARVIAGESFVERMEIVVLSGNRRQVEVHATPFSLPDASPARLCIARDITGRQEAEDALRKSEERLRLVQDATGLADFEAAADGAAICSDRLLEQLGLKDSPNRLEFEQLVELLHPEDRKRFENGIDASLETGEYFQSEFRIIRPDTGETRWILSHTKTERDEAGNPVRTIGAHLDITKRKEAEEAIRESEERFRLAAEAAGLGVWDYDSAAERQELSERFREILGLGPGAEASLSVIMRSIHPADRTAFIEELLQITQSGLHGRFEKTLRIHRLSDSAERWISMNGWKSVGTSGSMHRIIITIRDITSERTAEERIRWSASHDALTGLANRSLFQEELDRAIDLADASVTTVGLLVLDVDHFKQINDTLGHDAGDELLKAFARRVEAAMRSDDVVARLGGDEFAIVIPRLRGEEQLVSLSNSIIDRLREPMVYKGQILDCRVSIGACMYPTHGSTGEELLKSADVALYASKSSGRATTTLFKPELRDDIQRANAMVLKARNAIQDDRIVPYYQPKIDLRSGAVVGFEALLRWRDAQGRMQAPSAIASAFDDLDMAAAISDRMADRAIADMRRWLDNGIKFEHVAINASAAEFRRDDFAERLLERLEKADISTQHFQLEVTETVFLGRGADYVHRALALLSSNGVKIALDDFGTGYASLRHLKEFPVDTIKIDKSFVRDMESDREDEEIIRAVLNLGRNLGIRVVAEGIETREQARFLAELDCDFGQGFLFAKAKPASRVAKLIEKLDREYSFATSFERGEDGLRLVASGS